MAEHAGKSHYLERAMLDHILGRDLYVPPNTVYLALFTTTVGEDGDGTEVALTVDGNPSGYARLAIDNTVVEFPPAEGDPAALKTNAFAKTFPVAQEDWGNCVAWALMDAPSAGNVLYYGEFGRARIIQQGDTAVVGAGSIRITED